MDVKPEEEFAPLDKLHCYRPVIRLLNLPVLFRLASNLRSANPKSSRLIGHPRLLQLPNLVSPKSLYDTVKNIYPKVNAFDLCFVDQQVLFSVRNLFKFILDIFKYNQLCHLGNKMPSLCLS
jgi:hypothetical protein